MSGVDGGLIEAWTAICLSIMTLIMLGGIPWAHKQNGRLSSIETAMAFVQKGVSDLRKDNPPPEVKQALDHHKKEIEDLWTAVNKLRDASPSPVPTVKV